jgi:hypothetical protein
MWDVYIGLAFFSCEDQGNTSVNVGLLHVAVSDIYIFAIVVSLLSVILLLQGRKALFLGNYF